MSTGPGYSLGDAGGACRTLTWLLEGKEGRRRGWMVVIRGGTVIGMTGVVGENVVTLTTEPMAATWTGSKFVDALRASWITFVSRWSPSYG